MAEPRPLPDDLQHRAFSRADAERAGVGQGRLRRRDIRRPFHGVQIVSSFGTLRERCTAYRVRMKPGQSFSHQTAVLLQGLPLARAFEEELDLHVAVVMPGRAPTTRGVVGHRIRIAPPVVDLGGLPVVRMDEAWAQMAPLLAVDELIELGDAVLWADRELLDAMRAAAHVPYRPAGDRLRKALREIRRGCASPGETRVRLLLTRAGIREPELNAEVYLPGEVVHPDLIWRDRMVAVEYEGGDHLEREQFQYDIQRYERMREHGWTVIRVTADQLRGPRASALIRRVKALVG
ncbi:endonuclease domain-containing protein [Amnibacterium sp.]|uniref:endonuclease domain-containing protein n=1 Tax=Amnibacterium sp. TaxID=1872496 RepID=UPI003F7C4D34